MEEALLGDSNKVESKRREVATWDLFVQELKKVSYIAMPMVVVTVSQHFSRVSSMMMVGHLGELSLSGTSIATSLTNVTGFSLLFGMASALETLCGQAYGGGLYHKLGTCTYAAVISLIMVCIPISVLWLFLDKLLIFIGQDHLISTEAGRYAVWLIPALFPYAVLQALIRYLQTQTLIMPMLLSSVGALCFHLPVCWAFVFYLKLGNAGAALALGLSYWFNVILLVLYVKYSEACERTRITFSSDALLSIGEFFKFAVPSAVMVCLEWWTFEIVILLSGLLPNPQLEASVLSICLLIASLHFYVPYSVGAAASTRVSNELGAGNPEAARVAVWAVIVISISEVIIAATTLLCCRRFLGYAFSDEKEVVDYLKELTPLVCLLVVMDGIQAVLSGVARGSGWQHLGAYVNLGVYYLVGIPVAVMLGFVLHLEGRGLWIGLNVGSVLQSVLLSLITSFTNWEKEANMARGRIFDRGITADK
ncbi:hypothetical protein ACH5RR_013865 [Cinchona calisaya]|uniref:Protein DETOXIFICATION n=1 Tax=Cinchona calisaya TaxID=153742 RepID=A0ABD3A1S6_9GENT